MKEDDTWPKMSPPRLVRWEAVRDALQAENRENPDATTTLAQHIARQINKGDNRMRYHDHQFLIHECCLGLKVDRYGRVPRLTR